MVRCRLPTEGKARCVFPLLLWCVGGMLLFVLASYQHSKDGARAHDPVASATVGRRALTGSPQRKKKKKKKSAQAQRPVMHTFFGHLDQSKSVTGMTDSADRHLLEVWREAWSAAGWEPRILDLSDAMEHRDFEKYDAALTDGNVHDPYNKLCYLRWLAMAASGGGWMSDYDVLPLPTDRQQTSELPRDGRLTLHEYTVAGGVPSLVSGTADEWDRVAHLLLEKSYDPDITSDMFALLWYHEHDPDTYGTANKVIKGHVPLSGRVRGKELCDVFKTYTAIHFSHAAIRAGVQSGLLAADVGPGQRAQVAYDWIKDWINLCGVRE